jgi:hypothetical protein
MKIVKRSVYKLDRDELIAENVKEVDACLICCLLNENKNRGQKDFSYYYQVVTDEYELKG